jgi:nitrilase
VVIDPWGKVVARKAKGEGYVEAEIDLGLVGRVRRGLPCLDHLRPELLGRERKR